MRCELLSHFRLKSNQVSSVGQAAVDALVVENRDEIGRGRVCGTEMLNLQVQVKRLDELVRKTASKSRERPSGRDGNDPERAARSADDLQRRSNDHSTGWRKLIQVAQARQTELSAAVHQIVVREGRIEAGCLSGVGPNRLHADPQHISFVRQK